MKLLAWVQANLMSMWAKKGKTIKPKDLLRTDRTPSFVAGGGSGEARRFDDYMRAKRQRMLDRKCRGA